MVIKLVYLTLRKSEGYTINFRLTDCVEHHIILKSILQTSLVIPVFDNDIRGKNEHRY